MVETLENTVDSVGKGEHVSLATDAEEDTLSYKKVEFGPRFDYRPKRDRYGHVVNVRPKVAY